MATDPQTILGTRIREAREKCNLTQKQVAQQVGLSLRAISSIECCEANPTFLSLLDLIEFFDLSPNSLFQENVPPEVLSEDNAQRLIHYYQSCSPMGRRLLMQAAQSIALETSELSDNTMDK